MIDSYNEKNIHIFLISYTTLYRESLSKRLECEVKVNIIVYAVLVFNSANLKKTQCKEITRFARFDSNCFNGILRIKFFIFGSFELYEKLKGPKNKKFNPKYTVKTVKHGILEYFSYYGV